MPMWSGVRYGTVAQSLHWITAILVLIAFIYGPGGPEQRIYSPSRDFGRQLHETLGLCVFALTLLRVLWRIADRRPEPVPAPRWMEMAAKSVQAALYLLLLALPVTAVSGAWLEGHPLTLMAGLTVPPPIAKLHGLGAVVAEVHGWLGDAIIWLAGLHACAALLHHYLFRDAVLTSMLPDWFPLPGSKQR